MTISANICQSGEEYPLSLARLSSFLSRWAIVIFVFWALFLSFEYYGYGENSFVVIHDTADGTLSIKIDRGKEGRWITDGFWETNQLGGMDALLEEGVADLSNVLFHVLPGWLAYASLMFLQRFVAGFFTFLVLTRQLRVNPLFALPASFLYALFFQNQINLQYSGFTAYDSFGLPGVPAILYVAGLLAQKAEQKPQVIFFLSLLLGLIYAGVSFFAYTVFIFPFLFLWFLLFIPGNQKWLVLVGISAGWLAVDFVEMAAASHWFSFSQRTMRSYCPTDGFGSRYWSKTFNQNLIYTSNLFPVLIASLAIWFPTKNNAEYRNAVKLFALSILFMLVGNLFLQFACADWNSIELLKGFNLSRFYLYFPLLAALASGTGLNSIWVWSQSASTRIRQNIAIVTLVIAFSLLAVTCYDSYQVKRLTNAQRIMGSDYANLYRNPYLELIAEHILEQDPHARAVMLVNEESDSSFLALPPGILWAYGLRTLDGYANLYTLGLRDYWLAMIDPMMELYPECRYGLRLGKGETRVYLNNACDVSTPVDITTPSHLFDLDLLQLAGVRYVISPSYLGDSSLIPVDVPVDAGDFDPHTNPFFLYETPSPQPLLSTRSKTKTFDLMEKLLNQLRQTSLTQLSETAFLDIREVSSMPMASLGPAPAHIDLVNDQSDQLLIDFFAEDAKILVVAQTYTEDWKAFVDGKQVNVFSVFRAWTGLYVPSGQHTIELLYAPKYSPKYLNFWLKVNWDK